MDEWFLPSIQDDFDLQATFIEQHGEGCYREADWAKAVLVKADKIIGAINDNWADIFVYADCDIQFFRPVKEVLHRAIRGHDIVCQQDHPAGVLCTGFFICRANRKTLRLWKRVRESLRSAGRDQPAFNALVRRPRNLRERLWQLVMRCRVGRLPTAFFGGGTFSGKPWRPGDGLFVPDNAAMHHANWTVGVDRKVAQLSYVRATVDARAVPGHRTGPTW